MTGLHKQLVLERLEEMLSSEEVASQAERSQAIRHRENVEGLSHAD